MSGHTPGPWYFDEAGNIWRRPPSDLYQNGGGVAGDRPLATAHEGWHGEDDGKYPLVANARLIAAAPELLEALQGLDEAYCRAGTDLTREERHEDRLRLIAARAAIAKATGETA